MTTTVESHCNRPDNDKNPPATEEVIQSFKIFIFISFIVNSRNLAITDNNAVYTTVAVAWWAGAVMQIR